MWGEYLGLAERGFAAADGFIVASFLAASVLPCALALSLRTRAARALLLGHALTAASTAYLAWPTRLFAVAMPNGDERMGLWPAPTSLIAWCALATLAGSIAIVGAARARARR